MKQLFCMFLSILLFVSLLLCPVTAKADESLQVVVPSLEAKPGEVIEVPVRVDNNSGIVSVKVQLAYNAAVLTLESMKAADFKGISFSPLTNNPLTLNWIDSLHGNNTTNGALAILTFRVAQTAPSGNYPLTLTANANDIFDFDFVTKPCTLVSGEIKVVGEEPSVPPVENPPVDNPNNPPVDHPINPPTDVPVDTPTDVPVDTPTDTDVPTPTDIPEKGDVEADGVVNAKDALAVLKITVNKVVPTQLQKVLADVNGDNTVNAKDALEILKYAVGKPSCLAK